MYQQPLSRGRSDNNICFDWIRITRDDGCEKLIVHYCDDPDACNWHDKGWDCGPGGGGGSVLPTGERLPSAYDTNGNLVCMVAVGQGGTFSPNGQDNVYFAPANGTTLTIAASLLVSSH